MALGKVYWSSCAEQTGSALERELPEKEEEAPAQKFNVRAQLDELVEEFQDVGDVGEGQHQERLLQLTEEGSVTFLSAAI